MIPTENLTIKFSIFTFKVENDITIHITIREKTIAASIFNLLRIAQNDNFLNIPIVNLPDFEMVPGENQTANFLEHSQIH